MKMFQLNIAAILLYSISSCDLINESMVSQYNDCYQSTLSELRTRAIYKEVRNEFREKFEIWMLEIYKFNDIHYNYQIVDDAVFFSSDSTNCLMLILQQSVDQAKLDHVHVIHGKKCGDKWNFLVSMHISYHRDDLPSDQKKYSLQRLSLLARSDVLSLNSNLSSCNINEKFWFEEMPLASCAE